MGTKSREVIWGGQIIGAKNAREAARKAAREADRADPVFRVGCGSLQRAEGLSLARCPGTAQPLATV